MKLKTLIFVALLVLFSALTIAATLPPAPPVKSQFLDNSGKPLSGGKIYTYTPGTTTPKATYNDSTGTVANANPVILDSAGRANIWLNGAYKFVVKDRNDYLMYTVDNVSSMPYTAPSSATQSQQWVDSGLVPTYLNARSFSVSSDQTAVFEAGRRVRIKLNSGYAYSTVVSSAYTLSSYTTVTVINDSLALNNSMSDAYVGVLTASNPSIPILTALGGTTDITADYTITQADLNRLIVLNPTGVGADLTITLPTPSATPGGSFFMLKSIASSTEKVIVNGYVDNQTGLFMYGQDMLFAWNDGDPTQISWYGKIMTQTPGNDNVVPVTGAGAKIATGFLPDLASTFTVSVYSGFTTTVNSGATATLATFPVGTVKTNDIVQVNVSAFVTRCSTSDPGRDFYLDGRTYTYSDVDPVTNTATMVSGAGSEVYSYMTYTARPIYMNTSYPMKITGDGYLSLNVYGSSLDNDCSVFSLIKFSAYHIFKN